MKFLWPAVYLHSLNAVRRPTGSQSRPWVISQVLKRRAFSWVSSRQGSAASSSFAFGQLTSSRFRTKNGQGKLGVVISFVSRTVFWVPLTHIHTWAGTRSPHCDNSMNASRTACIETERAVACGRPADVRAKPCCLVWYWYVLSAAGPLDNKQVVSKSRK